MTITTIALGDSSKAKAQALLPHFPSLLILTEAERKPDHAHASPAISARLMKTAFASYLPQNASGPVILLDADIAPAVQSPFTQLPTLTAPIAGVPWFGGVHYPSPFNVVPSSFPALNSGMLVFVSLEAAQTVCDMWHANYTANLGRINKDEPSLSLTLFELGITPQILPQQWNARRSEGAILLHQPYVMPEVTPHVPRTIANWRAKAVAEILGLTEQVNTIIDAMPGPEGIVMSHAWYGGGDVTRALIDSFAPMLDPVPTSTQIDQWMIQAANLLK